MLIESACSVDRVEETLSTLLPMFPEIQYFRFNPGKLLLVVLDNVLDTWIELIPLYYCSSPIFFSLVYGR